MSTTQPLISQKRQDERAHCSPNLRSPSNKTLPLNLLNALVTKYRVDHYVWVDHHHLRITGTSYWVSSYKKFFPRMPHSDYIGKAFHNSRRIAYRLPFREADDEQIENPTTLPPSPYIVDLKLSPVMCTWFIEQCLGSYERTHSGIFQVI